MLTSIVGLVAYVLIGCVSIIYHRWVLSPKAQGFEYPLLLAFCVKVYLAILYFTIAFFARMQKCKDVLYGPPELSAKTHWRRWVKFIVAMVFMSVISLSFDTLAYVFIDLTTKQVIDACMPLMIMIFHRPAKFLRPRRQTLGTVSLVAEQVVGEQEFLLQHRPRGVKFWLVEKGSVVMTVLGTVLIIMHVQTVSVIGVVLDAFSLVSSTWSTYISKFLLHQHGWTFFVLLIVTIIPEAILMGWAAYFVHGADAFEGAVVRIAVGYAVPIVALSSTHALLGLSILKNASALSYTVAGNVVMATIILIDLFYIKDRDAPKLINWIGFGVFVVSMVVYTGTIWWKLPKKVKPADLSARLATIVSGRTGPVFLKATDSEEELDRF
jgi:hypothetical protein